MSSPNQKEQTPADSRKKNKEKPASQRNTFVYIGTIVILIITIIAFVFVPSIGGSVANTGKLPDFGSYAGEPIRYEQGGYLARQVKAVDDQIKSSGYNQMDSKFLAFQVWKAAYDRTVVHVALLHEAKRAGISVSEDRLNDGILEYPEFLDNGVFSLEKYRDTSESAKLSIRNSLQEEILKGYITDDVLSLRPSSRELNLIKSIAREERVIEYVEIPFSAFSDAEKAGYGRQNAAKFRRINVSRVTLNDDKEAAAVLAKVNDGSLSFEEAAKTHSKDAWADQGGASGSRWGYEIDSELASAQDSSAVLALKAGEISSVYKMASGSWCFFRAESGASEPDFSSPDVLKAVWEYMNQWERGKIEEAAVARGKDFTSTASAKGFASTAVTSALPVLEAGPFPLNYGDAFSSGSISLFRKLSAKGLSGASSNEIFLTAVFSSQAGAISDPILLKDSVAVIRIKEIRPADEGSLELMGFYYPYLFSQDREMELYDHFLKSPKLKDNFMAAYTHIFQEE